MSVTVPLRLFPFFPWILFLAALPVATTSAATAVLFHDVNVVLVDEGKVLEHRDVLTRDGRIESVRSSEKRPANADVNVIDGKGGYLMPGLAEMHVHLPPIAKAENPEDMLFLFLAHGITTIRSAVGDPQHLELRKQVEKGELLGPRMYIAAPPLRASNTTNTQELSERIRKYAAEKYDFLKLHPSLLPPAFDTMVATARASHITFEGHVPEAVGLEQVLKARMRAIDHIDGYIQALADPNCAEKPKAPGFFGIAYIQCVQMSRLPALLEQAQAAGTWIIPTLTHLQTWTRLPSWESLAARPEMRYVPKATIQQWHEQHISLVKNAPAPERANKFIAVMQTILREMQAKGIPIALGSDTPQAWNIPGHSTLEEMVLSVEAGLTPAQVLRTATTNPARFMDAEKRVGLVQPGMEADLILIDANPLADVNAVRKLRGVMVRGRWLDRQTIDDGLDRVASRAATRL